MLRIKSVCLSLQVTILVLILLISLVACGGSSSSNNSVSSSTAVSHNPPATSVTPTPSVDRHGLPVDVPLPDGAIFNSQGQSLLFNVGPVHLPQLSIGCYGFPTNQTWVWTTSSPNTPAVLQQFYQNHLSTQGWSHLLTSASCNSGNPLVSACGNGNNKQQIVLVQFGATITLVDGSGNSIGSVQAPTGGAAMGISVVTAQSGQTNSTLGVYIPGSADIFCS